MRSTAYGRDSHKVQIKNASFRNDDVIQKNSAPFFNIPTEDAVVKLFMEALTNSDADGIKAYISKNLSQQFDLDELKDFFRAVDGYKCLSKAGVADAKNNFRTNSILVLSNETKNSIIHLHMVKEPDRFGKWKIYGFERE